MNLNIGYSTVKRSSLGKTLRFASFLILSFAVPLRRSLLRLKSNGFYPFDNGGYTISRIDFQSQYISYLRYYRNLLSQHGSFIYTTSKAFGGDFRSIFTYYLASPFNLLLPLISEADIPFFILVADCLKSAFASLFFYLLCHYKFSKDHLRYIGLSVGYGLRSYFFVYASNFRWLDSLRLLPLVLLGYERLKDEKHLWLYPLSVFLVRRVGWYIGARICLFLLLLFITDFVSNGHYKKEGLPFLFRFGILSLIGGLLAGVFWIPAFLHLSGTKAYVSMPNGFFNSFFYFFEGFRENGYCSSSRIRRNSGYRTRFVGRIPLVLARLFFFNKGFTLRKRLSYLVLFLVYVFVSVSIPLNALFHGGREPSWFPCRYSFIRGFLVCYRAAYQFSSDKKTELYGFLVPFIPRTLVLIVLRDGKDLSGHAVSYSVPSLVLYCVTIVLCFAAEMIKRYKPACIKFVLPTLSLALAPLACYSSYRGRDEIIKTNIADKQYQSQDTYREDLVYQADVDALKKYAENDNPYRMERTFNRPGNYNVINNNPMFYNYSGLSHYSSSEKKNVESYRTKLGFHYNGYFEGIDGGSTLGRTSLLGLKYFIDRSDSYTSNRPRYPSNTGTGIRKQLPLKGSDSNIAFYENTKALPLGYSISHTTSTYIGDGRYNDDGSVYWFDSFEYQNEIFQGFVPDVVDKDGKKKDIYVPIDLGTNSGTASISELGKDGYYCLNGKKGQTLSFTFTVPKEAYGRNLYRGEKNNRENLNFFLDGNYREINTYWHKGIRGFEDNYSHTHRLSVTLLSDRDNVAFRPEIYYEDADVLTEYLDALSSSHTELKETKGRFSYGYKGTFYKYGDKDFLFTLPYEKGVSVYLDGKKRKAETRFAIFTGLDRTGIEDGKHTIEFRYTDNGLKIGRVVTILAILSLGAVLVLKPKFIYEEGSRSVGLIERRKKHGH